MTNSERNAELKKIEILEQKFDQSVLLWELRAIAVCLIAKNYTLLMMSGLNNCFHTVAQVDEYHFLQFTFYYDEIRRA